ncbi:MAG: hypothetical protein K2F78_04420, partial [Muribaculaceae bacterium]|nr:hypothetical protein [Muribaculaceae bacterium]
MTRTNKSYIEPVLRFLTVVVCGFCAFIAASAQERHLPVKHRVEAADTVAGAPDSVDIVLGEAEIQGIIAEPDDDTSIAEESPYDRWEEREVAFNPDPTRAVWMAALFPGLGQLYNRRYWKLPIVVGAYMGLAYATTWNNGMLSDYTRAYRDIMDSDPGTNSYMNFFPPNTQESDLDRTWLTNVLQSRKNYFRRNRDLCIIAMIGVYLVAMVDAYVDASLSHFDITPELSMDVSPA